MAVARREAQSAPSSFDRVLTLGRRLSSSTRPVLLAMLGCAGLLATGAQAGAAPLTIKVANWSGGAVFKGPAKQFDHCAATSNNKDGIAMTYAIDRQLRWDLRISNPAWTFTNDFGLSVNLALDGRRFRGRAIVRENSSLQMEVEDPISLFATLRMATQLRLTAGGLATEFDLTNSSEVLSAVAQCALKNGNTQRGGRKPAGKKADRIEANYDPAAQKEAIALANALKDHAGMATFRVQGAADGLPGARAAVGWNADNARGAVITLPPHGAGRVAEVTRQIIEFEQGRCRGEYFFVSSLEPGQPVEVARTYAACKMTESTTITYYLAVPRSRGGAYVLSNTSGQGFALTLQRQTETVDARLRVALVEALRRLEHEQAFEAAGEPGENSSPTKLER